LVLSAVALTATIGVAYASATDQSFQVTPSAFPAAHREAASPGSDHNVTADSDRRAVRSSGLSAWIATYPVSITEQGLPSVLPSNGGFAENWVWAIWWTATPKSSGLDGNYSESFDPTIDLNLVNGSYDGYVTGPCCEPAFFGEPLYISFSVTGRGLNLTQPMGLGYNVVLGVDWVGGGSIPTTNCTLAFMTCKGGINTELPNGTYNYTFTQVNGYHLANATGTITVNGSNVDLVIVATPTYYQSFMIEAGLPPGTFWQVEMNGVGPAPEYFSSWNNGLGVEPGTNRSVLPIGFANGSISFLVEPVRGFEANPSRGNVTINGSGTWVAIEFTPVPESVPTESSSGYWLVLSGLGGFMIGALTIAALIRVVTKGRRGMPGN
jgi:hypothetical protein